MNILYVFATNPIKPVHLQIAIAIDFKVEMYIHAYLPFILTIDKCQLELQYESKNVFVDSLSLSTFLKFSSTV